MTPKAPEIRNDVRGYAFHAPGSETPQSNCQPGQAMAWLPSRAAL